MLKTCTTFAYLILGLSTLSNTPNTTENCTIEIDAIRPTYCNATLEGQITISASGGKQPYLYRINNGSFSKSGTFNNITSNNYDITVKDKNGCEITLYTYIAIPIPIKFTHELENKTLTVTVNRKGNYQYKLNDNRWVNSPIFTNVAVVNKIAIKTPNGCEIIKSIERETQDNTTTVFKLYPNPATDYLFIKGSNKLLKIRIINSFGKTILTHKANKSIIKLNVSELKGGVYLIQVIDINGNKDLKKLVIN